MQIVCADEMLRMMTGKSRMSAIRIGLVVVAVLFAGAASAA